MAGTVSQRGYNALKLEIIGQQLGVEHPSWYTVKNACPQCGAKEIPWTLTRYGQSSSLKVDQTGTALKLGGFGAGLHTNRFTLKCRCGFEVEVEEPTEEKLPMKVESGKLKFEEKVVVAGSEFKLPGDYKFHESILRFPNLTAGRKTSKIDLYHKGAIPELLTKLRSRNALADGTPGPFQFSYQQLADWLNEKARAENKVTEAATINKKTVFKWVKKNYPERQNG